MKISIRYKLFLSHFVAILLVSGSIGSYFYNSAIDNLEQSLRSRLKYSAALLAHNFDPSELDRIEGEADLNSDLYLRNIEKLRALSGSNPDIAFIYVMRQNRGLTEFVLDSDPDDPAAPGEEYSEYIEELQAGFSELSVDSEITTDRWGSFMSGYAPISGGKIPYLVGIDMRANEVSQKLEDLRERGLISLIASIALAYFCAHFLSQNLLRRIKLIHNRCLEIAPLKSKVKSSASDELEGLNHAFNYMVSSVQATHEELELEVDKRTQELRDTNKRLSDEVEERRRMENVVQENARTDLLTGLTNRREVTNKLNNTASLQTPFSIILIDIDNFRKINDAYGFNKGDELLRKFARTLLYVSNKTHCVARWEGKRFIVTMNEADKRDALTEAKRIHSALNGSTFNIQVDDLEIELKYGIAEHKASDKWEETYSQADSAMTALEAD